MDFPPLYIKDAKGMDRVWTVRTEGNVSIVTHGCVDGAMTEQRRSYKTTNAGRSNEVDPETQAQREAERDWVKKLTKGYAPRDPKGKKVAAATLKKLEKSGGVRTGLRIEKKEEEKNAKEEEDSEEEEEPAPKKAKKSGCLEHPIAAMLCKDWDVQSNGWPTAACLKHFDLEEGMYVQPKLDGVRCIVSFDEGAPVLTTRNGKKFVHLNHLRTQLRMLRLAVEKKVPEIDPENLVLDGEIYAPDILGEVVMVGNKSTYRDSRLHLSNEQRFDVISGAARPTRTSAHPLEKQLSFFVFDALDITKPSMPQGERLTLVQHILSRAPAICTNISLVPSILAYAIEEIDAIHGDITANQGYEGIVIRSSKLIYQPGRRALGMRKRKDSEDAEFEVIGAALDPGVEPHHFVWNCRTKGGETFSVKPMGDEQMRQEMWNDRKKYLGKMMTVRYQALTELGVPRFPRAVAIRDYE